MYKRGYDFLIALFCSMDLPGIGYFTRLAALRHAMDEGFGTVVRDLVGSHRDLQPSKSRTGVTQFTTSIKEFGGLPRPDAPRKCHVQFVGGK
jgi:hypothetical protein